ncbi:MAG: NUDIX hydrolase, partial [Pseudomonadota bacterium]
NGETGIYSVVTKPAFAVVAPLGEGKLHLVRQFRYPLGFATLEFPQGAAPDAMTGGGAIAVEEVAHRELREETGLSAGRMERLGRIHPDTGLIDQTGEVFLAGDLTEGEPEREPSEADMTSEAFAVEEVLAMARREEITDAPTLAAIALLLLHRKL